MLGPIGKCMVAAVACWLGCLSSAATPTDPAPPPPNILVIVSDDAGYTDFGFTGSDQIPTPRIDSIAERGVAFSAGYVTASVCSPSRAGLLTGRYQQRFGHECNLSDQPGAGMPAAEQTLAESLRAAGYRTGAFGKWHLGHEEGMRPTEQGFDRFQGLLGGSRSYLAVGRDGARPGEMHALRDGLVRVDEPEGLYLTDWIAARAASFVGHRDDAGIPFFAYVAFTAPHTPMEATEADLAPAREIVRTADDLRITYVALMLALDRGVGQILDAIDAAGQTENTLVFFINDNGGATNNGSDNGPFRGMKGSKWEGGVRVPFAACWPAGFGPRAAFEHPVSALDIAATARAAAGAHGPGDGIDLLEWLTGRTGGAPDRALFWRRDVAAAVRRGEWKLIRSEGNPPLLFDLRADPGERHNLSAAAPAVAAGLLDELETWEAGLVAPGWLEGERWRRNQVLKHRMDVIGREAERRFP